MSSARLDPSSALCKEIFRLAVKCSQGKLPSVPRTRQLASDNVLTNRPGPTRAPRTRQLASDNVLPKRPVGRPRQSARDSVTSTEPKRRGRPKMMVDELAQRRENQKTFSMTTAPKKAVRAGKRPGK